MRPSLSDIVRKILTSSALLSTASRGASAVTIEGMSKGEELDHIDHVGGGSNGEVVLREARPRLVLQPSGHAHSFSLFSSHRSHRSHSSHRSHYSSSAPRTAPTKAPTPTKAPQPSRPDSSRPASVRSDSNQRAVGSVLGSRTLSKGMRGADVEALTILLVHKKLLATDKIPNEPLFTTDMEAAVKAFQVAQKLPADGKVDYRTLLLLRAQ